MSDGPASVRSPYRAAAPPSEWRCPRCPGHAFLRRDELGTTTVHRCEHCSGTWLSRGSFELLRDDPARQSELANVLGDPRRVVADEGTAAECPECAAPMGRLVFPRRSGVTLDRCETHGVWFDPGELASAVGTLTRERGGFIDGLIQLVERWP